MIGLYVTATIRIVVEVGGKDLQRHTTYVCTIRTGRNLWIGLLINNDDFNARLCLFAINTGEAT